jgi:putative two-component system response regulator
LEVAVMENPGAKVLVLGHEPENSEKLSLWLACGGHSPIVALDPNEARELLESAEFDVVLNDYATPGIPTAELDALIQDLKHIPALLVTVDLADREAAASILDQQPHDYIVKPLLASDVLSHVERGLDLRRLVTRNLSSREPIEPKVLDRARQVMAREEEIVFRLLGGLSLRSDETRNHVRRVGLNAALLAKHLGWQAEAVADIRLAAAMHDVGEVGIPDSILLKPGKLSPEEFALVKKHTEIGAGLLEGSEVPMLQMAREIALCHHEKWDGTGYPNGLSGEEIPEAARIVAVVDVYDALTSERVYRPPLTLDEALSVMLANRDSYFEPRIVDRFLALLPEIDLGKSTEVAEEEEVDIELA